MDITPGKRKLIEKIVNDRELPEEVLDVLKLVLQGELELKESEYPQLVKALLKSPDEGDGKYRIGGTINR